MTLGYRRKLYHYFKYNRRLKEHKMDNTRRHRTIKQDFENIHNVNESFYNLGD